MSKVSWLILRVGLGVTFLWIGILIFQNPDAWANFIQPWVLKLLPVSPHSVMIETSFLDLAIGFFLLINRLTWLAALVGFLHLVTVLIASGIDDITVRDIGLLGGCLALGLETLPANLQQRLFKALHVKS